jgi:hypothetical protein
LGNEFPKAPVDISAFTVSIAQEKLMQQIGPASFLAELASEYDRPQLEKAIYFLNRGYLHKTYF